MARFLKLLPALLLVLALDVPTAAFAHGHGGSHGGSHGAHGGHGGGVHSHVFFGFGCCGYWPGYYPAYYPYYYGYPAYPTDPYAYSAPAVVYQAPSANCRQFNGNATIDASGQPFYGTACLESDGRWHITGP